MYNLQKSESEIDGLLVSGDLTNYGDENSLKYFYDTIRDYCPTDKLVIAAGNHDIGHVEDITHEQARLRLMDYYNTYTASEIEHIYYSTVINGYTFIVLGDESDDSWDHAYISDSQLKFLDTQLAAATASGLPAFVVCHQPLEGVNGQPTVWEDGAIGDESAAIQQILEKYENVFFISGHLHEGVNSKVTHELFNVHCAETINGVNYINLPAYMYISRFGIPWACIGMQMEVYEDEIVFRARNFVSESWYVDYEYSFNI